MSTSSLRVVVTGLMAQYPLGGMTWHYLQYVLGLRRLGHDVYYLEDTGDAVYSPGAGGSTIRDCTFNVEYLARVMARFGLAERWAYHFSAGSSWYGRNVSSTVARHDGEPIWSPISSAGCSRI